MALPQIPTMTSGRVWGAIAVAPSSRRAPGYGWEAGKKAERIKWKREALEVNTSAFGGIRGGKTAPPGKDSGPEKAGTGTGPCPSEQV